MDAITRTVQGGGRMSVLIALLVLIGAIIYIVLEIAMIVICIGALVLLVNLIISYVRDLWKAHRM